jgi:hypothetical protein
MPIPYSSIELYGKRRKGKKRGLDAEGPLFGLNQKKNADAGHGKKM